MVGRLVGDVLGHCLWLRDSCRGLLHAARYETLRLAVCPRRMCLRFCVTKLAGIARGRGRPLHHGWLFRARAPGLRGLPVLHRKALRLRVNPEPFLQLDRVIHEKGRLAIMSLLGASDQLAFTEMRETLGMTDGNLTTHLRTLHEAGYVAVTK